MAGIIRGWLITCLTTGRRKWVVTDGFKPKTQKSRYDGLKSYIDILNGANTGYLATIKRIEELYDRMTADYPKYEDRVEFDRLCNNMPPEVWLQ